MVVKFDDHLLVKYLEFLIFGWVDSRQKLTTFYFGWADSRQKLTTISWLNI
jgi:hypothetical protein